MSEETLDLCASALVFGLALYAWLRRRSVVNVANVKERIEEYGA